MQRHLSTGSSLIAALMAAHQQQDQQAQPPGTLRPDLRELLLTRTRTLALRGHRSDDRPSQANPQDRLGQPL